LVGGGGGCIGGILGIFTQDDSVKKGVCNHGSASYFARDTKGKAQDTHKD
jgi:hypothetical protein